MAAVSIKECLRCGAAFNTQQKTHGPITLCNECSGEDVEPLGGFMLWTHKTAPELVLLASMTRAKQVAKLNSRRNGQSPLGCIIQGKETRESSELDGKRGSGAEFHAGYRSNLGEARTVKDQHHG